MTSVTSFNVQVENGKHTGSYTISLHGGKGDGSVDATVHVINGKTIIDKMKLTGPNGTSYNLISDGSTAVWLVPKTRFAALSISRISQHITG